MPEGQFVEDTTRVTSADPEIAAAEDGAAEGVEFDYGDAAAPGELISAEVAADEGRPSMPDAPGPEDDDGPTGVGIEQSVLNRIEAAERAAMEAKEELARIKATAPTEAADDKPPKPLEELQTMQDVAEYNAWLIRKGLTDITRHSAASAAAASSEQRARGLFNKDAMGEGFEYDAMINKYIAPIEQQSPRARELFYSQRDPAMARYSIAFLMEMTERFGGDPVKAIREVRRAINGPQRASAQVVEKIRQHEQRGTARVAGKPQRTGASTGNGRVTAEQIDNMSIRDFLALKQKMRGAA